MKRLLSCLFLVAALNTAYTADLTPSIDFTMQKVSGDRIRIDYEIEVSGANHHFQMEYSESDLRSKKNDTNVAPLKYAFIEGGLVRNKETTFEIKPGTQTLLNGNVSISFDDKSRFTSFRYDNGKDQFSISRKYDEFGFLRQSTVRRKIGQGNLTVTKQWFNSHGDVINTARGNYPHDHSGPIMSDD